MSCILLFNKENYPYKACYVVLNGYIASFHNKEFITCNYLITGNSQDKLRDKMKKLNISDNQMCRLLDKCVGKDMSYLVECIRKYVKDRDYRKQLDKKRQWITDATDGMVLIVEKDIDFRSNSFSVRMSLKTIPFKKQVDYVKNNKQKLYDVLIKYISEKDLLMKKIGDFNFYYVSNITVTRASEVEFLFSLKPGIEEEL